MGYYGGYTDRDSLINELIGGYSAADGSKRMETVAHTLRGNVLWAVHRFVDKDGNIIPLADDERGAFIYCYLLSGRGSSWAYKPMEESCGPCYYTCPLKYLNMAAETSPDWREKVRSYHRSHNRKMEIGHWYEYANEGMVCISRLKPLCGFIDGTEYRLTHKEWIGECLTA